MADLVTTIKVDSKQFDNSIKSSTNQVRQFERENYKTGKSVEQFGGKISGIANGALMGMVGTLGLAKGAADIFMGSIRGSQTTSDDFDVAIAQAKTSVDYFFTAISTGNFTNFFDGLTEAIAQAKELTIVLDALSDMKVSERFFKAEEQFSFDTNRSIINDPDSTKEQKLKALADNEKILEGMAVRAEAISFKAEEAQLAAFRKVTASLEQTNPESLKKLLSDSKLKVTVGGVDTPVDSLNNKQMKEVLEYLQKVDLDKANQNDLALINEIYSKVFSGTDKDYLKFEKQYAELNKLYDDVKPVYVPNQGVAGGGGTTVSGSKEEVAKAKKDLKEFEDRNANNLELYNIKNVMLDKDMELITQLQEEQWNAKHVIARLENTQNRLKKRVKGGSGEEITPNASIAGIDKQIAGLNKKISLSVNEEDRRKLYKQIEELQAKKLEIETKYKAELELPQTSLAAIDKKIKELNQQILLSVDTNEMRALYKEIEALEKRRIMIKVVYTSDISSVSNNVDVEKGNALKQLEDSKKSGKPIAFKGVDIKESQSSMEAWNSTMNKIREDNWATIESFNGIAMSMSAIGNASDGSAAAMFKWAATTLGAIGQAIPAIMALTVAKEVEANASAKAAAAGAASSVAAIPIVGGILAVAAIASVVAAMSSIPKFAEGGLVYGNTIAQVGEYAGASNNPEVIAPLSKLRKILSDTNEGNGIGGSVEFKIAGKDLVGTINNYSSKQRKK